MTDIEGYVFNDPRIAHNVPYYGPGSWIQAFLAYFDLELQKDPNDPYAPSPMYVFTRERAWSKYRTLEQVVDTVVSEGAADGQTLDRDAIKRSIITRLSDAGPVAKDLGLSVSLTFVPTTWHWNKKLDPQDRDPPSLQVQGQYQLNIRHGDTWSLDYSLQAQMTFAYDTIRTRRISQAQFMAGCQLSMTEQKILSDFIELQEFVQLLDGVTFTPDNAGRAISKTVPSPVVATNQVAAGLQINFKLSKSLTLLIQGQFSATGSTDAGRHQATLTFDLQAVNVGVQFSF